MHTAASVNVYVTEVIELVLFTNTPDREQQTVMPVASSITYLSHLPAEFIEAVLILSAASDNPRSIAALSQTSRFFYDLIYRCPDQYLWHEIFLTTFDDPRPALNHLSTISKGHPRFDIRNFDWTREYAYRI